MLKSSSSEKKLVKPLKNCFLDPICIEKGSLWTTPKMKKNFFLVEITKADHQFSESFYFIKISYVLTELWIFFFLEWCFLSKKCHFHLKQLWLSLTKNNYSFDGLRRVCKQKTEMHTTWQIGWLPVQDTWLGLVSQSVIWGSMWPTSQTINNYPSSK